MPDRLEDERFATSSGRHAARAEVLDRVEAATAELATGELGVGLEAEGVPCAPIADFGQGSPTSTSGP